MSLRIEGQLRKYFTELDDEQGPIDIDALAIQLTPAADRRLGLDDVWTDGSAPQDRLDAVVEMELVDTTTEKEKTMKLKGSTALLLAAASVVVIAGIFFAIQSGSADSSPVVTDQPEDSIGRDGPADDLTGGDGTEHAPRATFVGSTCTYEGPTEFAFGSDVTFTVTNKSESTEVGFAVWKIPEGTTLDDIREKTIFGIGAGTYKALKSTPSAFDLDYTLSAVLDAPGTWALNCFDLNQDGDRPATLFTVREE